MSLPTPIAVPDAPAPVSATPAVAGAPASFAPSTAARSFAADFAAAKAGEATVQPVMEIPELPIQYEDADGNISTDPFGKVQTGQNSGRHPTSPDRGNQPAPAPTPQSPPAAPQSPPQKPASPLDSIISKLNFGEPPAQPPQPATPSAAPSTPGARDYTGFDEREIAYFKAMSNDAFNVLAPMYRDYRDVKPKVSQLESKLSEAGNVKFMASPEAFTLTPTYSVITRQTDALKLELDYWKDAYAAIRQNQDWYDLTEVQLDADGIPVKYTQSTPQKATPQAELDVLNRIRAAENLIAQQGNRLETERQKHVSTYTDFYKAVETPLNALLAPVASNPAFQAKVKATLNSVPPLLRANPLMVHLAGLATFTEALLTSQLAQQGQTASDNLASGATQSGVPRNKAATPTGDTSDKSINAPGFSLNDFKSYVANGRKSL